MIILDLEWNRGYDNKPLEEVLQIGAVRLAGLVPEDFSMAAAFLRGMPAKEDSPGMKALYRVAGRLEGEAIPLPEW